MHKKREQNIQWQLIRIQTNPKVTPADSVYTPPTTLRRDTGRGLSSRSAGVVRQQTQSVSLRLIPPVALSFALTSTIDAFISRPPLVLQRLSPRTQLSHQPSKSSIPPPPPPPPHPAPLLQSCPSSPPDALRPLPQWICPGVGLCSIAGPSQFCRSRDAATRHRTGHVA